MYDIAIVGYGPVGATLANLLGLAGWRVAVFEREGEVFPIPRAVHVDDEAQRIWQAAGVLDLVTPSFGGYPPDRQYLNAKGEVFFETHLERERPFGFQTHMYFHQPTLEAGLRAGVARYANVTCYLGREVVSLEQDAEQVRLGVRTVGTNGGLMSVSARYVVGCDGGRSFVRKQLGIRLRDLKFEQPWLVTDFYLKAGLSREDVGFPYAHQQHCNPAQPISFIPQGAKQHYRFEFMLPAHVSKAEAEQPAYVRQMLSRVVDLEQIDIVRGAVYTFHSLIAEQWRVGRVFIAGDAAHQMPPFAGQGMCSGLRDAHNLSWKLSLVLANKAHPALLDSYEQERKPHVTRMTRGTMFLGNLVQTQNPLRAFVRDWLFRTLFRIPALFGRIAHFALRSPKLTDGIIGGSLPKLAGTQFIQPPVKLADGSTCLLDDPLAPGFALLAFDCDPAQFLPHPPLRDRLPFTLAQIVPPNKPFPTQKHLPPPPTPPPILGEGAILLQDVEGQLTTWFRHHQAKIALLRPDRYLFGAYRTPQPDQLAQELSQKIPRPIIAGEAGKTS